MTTTRRIALPTALLALALVATTARTACAQFGSLGGGAERNVAKQADRKKAAGAGEISEATKKLHDTDPLVRLEGVKDLSGSSEKGAVPLLVEATADADPRVRIKAIDALGTLRATDATPALVQMLYLRDSEPWLKQHVLVALGKIGDNRATEPITDFVGRDPNKDLVGTAIFALGEIGDPKSIPELQKLDTSTTDQRLRQLGRDAIGKINAKALRPEIQVRALRPRDGEETKRPSSASAQPPVAY
ncbi:HEAT repeat domain-containing protein [bacterium]|nr:HEAT repeat domain-containing protein [bacterium]